MLKRATHRTLHKPSRIHSLTSAARSSSAFHPVPRYVMTGAAVAVTANTSANTAARVRRAYRVAGRQLVAPCTWIAPHIGWYGRGGAADAGPGNTGTIAFSIERGTSIAGTLDNGSPTKVMGDGATVLADQFLASNFGLASFPQDTTTSLRLQIDVAQNAHVCLGDTPGALDTAETDDGTVSQLLNTGDLVAVGTGGALVAQVPPFLGMVGLPTIPIKSCLIVGDSIAQYFNDVNDTSGVAGGGYIARSCVLEGIAFSKAARSTTTAQEWATDAAFLANLKLQMPYANTLITEQSINDPPARSAAQILADLQTVWSAFRTINPTGIILHIQCSTKTTSTNGWAAADGSDQTPSSGFETGGIVDVLRASIVALAGQAGGPDFLFDPRVYWCVNAGVGASGNLWKGTGIVAPAAGCVTNGGLHPETGTHIATVTPLRAALRALPMPPN